MGPSLQFAVLNWILIFHIAMSRGLVDIGYWVLEGGAISSSICQYCLRFLGGEGLLPRIVCNSKHDDCQAYHVTADAPLRART